MIINLIVFKIISFYFLFIIIINIFKMIKFILFIDLFVFGFIEFIVIKNNFDLSIQFHFINKIIFIRIIIIIIWLILIIIKFIINATKFSFIIFDTLNYKSTLFIKLIL